MGSVDDLRRHHCHAGRCVAPALGYHADDAGLVRRPVVHGETAPLRHYRRRRDRPTPTPDDFTIDAAGERYTGWTSLEDLPPYRFRLDNPQTVYDPTDDVPGGWIGFLLPAEIDAATPKLRLQFAGEYEGETRWPLPDDVAAALRSSAPHTHLDKLEVPESVPADESFEVTLTATNEGRGPGIFRAAVNESGPMYAAHAVRIPLEPGESRTASVTISGHIDTGVDQARIVIITQDQDVSRTVTLE